MLPKKNRLSLKREFKRLKKEGRLIQGKFFGLLINSRSTVDLQFARFSFVVSKKIDKRTNRRNRVKRLMSEVVSRFLPIIQPGTEGVFLIKKPALEADFFSLFQAVELSLKKATVLK